MTSPWGVNMSSHNLHITVIPCGVRQASLTARGPLGQMNGWWSLDSLYEECVAGSVNNKSARAQILEANDCQDFPFGTGWSLKAHSLHTAACSHLGLWETHPVQLAEVQGIWTVIQAGSCQCSPCPQEHTVCPSKWLAPELNSCPCLQPQC